MPWFDIIWDNEPGANVEHLSEHGVSVAEAEYVLMHPAEVERSRSSGRCIAFGRTESGRALAVVFEQFDASRFCQLLRLTLRIETWLRSVNE